MATVEIVDYRRTDLRTNVLMNPYWITSSLVTGADCEDKYAVLFSFPTADKMTMILDAVVQIVTACTASTLIDLGYHTLATDGVTTGGVATTVDIDDYIAQGAITVGTPGFYRAATSDWLTLRTAFASQAAPFVITGAASTVPCIATLQSNTGTIAAGTWRVHLLVTDLPGSF
jgi:hypothetical protein